MLSTIQRDVINSLVSNRNENSYFAGSSVFNEMRQRMSGDLDVFHPSSEECEKSFTHDVSTLKETGFAVEIVREGQNPFFAKAIIRRGEEQTEMDWAFDSGYRFFPAQKHPQFGYVLHEYDLLVGKIFACSSRMAVRDYYDICDAWRRGLPVVECLLAAPACDPGYSPEALLDAMGFHSKYRPEMFKELDFGKTLDDKELLDLCRWCKTMFIAMSRAARTAFKQLPFTEAGTLFLKKDTLKAFLPTPEELEKGDFVRNTGRNYSPAFLARDSNGDPRFGYSI